MEMEKENEYDTTRTFLPEFHIRFEKLSKSNLDSRKFADLLASGGRIKIKIKINKQNQDQDRDGVDPYILDQGSGASSNVEKENTHYRFIDASSMLHRRFIDASSTLHPPIIPPFIPPRIKNRMVIANALDLKEKVPSAPTHRGSRP